MVMAHNETINVISHHCDSPNDPANSFFLDHILNKSWFYLVCRENVLNYELLAETILKLKNRMNHSVIKLDAIHKNLYFLIAKIALSKESLQTKKTYLQQVKQVFDFKSEQDLLAQYNGKIDGKNHFETNVLIQVMKTIGLGRKHLLEAKLMEKESEKTLQFYSIE